MQILCAFCWRLCLCITSEIYSNHKISISIFPALHYYYSTNDECCRMLLLVVVIVFCVLIVVWVTKGKYCKTVFLRTKIFLRFTFMLSRECAIGCWQQLTIILLNALRKMFIFNLKSQMDHRKLSIPYKYWNEQAFFRFPVEYSYLNFLIPTYIINTNNLQIWMMLRYSIGLFVLLEIWINRWNNNYCKYCNSSAKKSHCCSFDYENIIFDEWKV